MTRIRFFVPYIVVPKGNSKRIVQRKGMRFAKILSPKRVITNAGRLHAAAARFAPPTPISGAVRVVYTFMFPWRKSESKKWIAIGARPHDVRPDLGNLTKQMDDVLAAAGFILNDGQIASYGDTCKIWGARHGVDVVIETIG